MLWSGWRGWRDALNRASWFLIGELPLSVVVLYFSLAIHGSLVSEVYRNAVGIITFGFAPLGLKLYTFLIDGFPLLGEPRTLISLFPFLLLVIPGLVVFAKAFRCQAAAVLAAQAAAIVYFLAYNDFWSVTAFSYGNIRYWVWLIPFWCLYAYLTVRVAWRNWGGSQLVCRWFSRSSHGSCRK